MWKEAGAVHISKKRQTEKAAKATTIEAQLRAEQKAHRATKKDLHNHKETMVSAPAPFAMPTQNPYAIAQATCHHMEAFRVVLTFRKTLRRSGVLDTIS